MNPVDAWLARRRPVPSAELAARMAAAAGGTGTGDVLHGLTERAMEALAQARRAPGRVRESAYNLLAADALLTYACEAALDAPDPAAALEELVSLAASPDG